MEQTPRSILDVENDIEELRSGVTAQASVTSVWRCVSRFSAAYGTAAHLAHSRRALHRLSFCPWCTVTAW
jgi:hypothetical protein